MRASALPRSARSGEEVGSEIHEAATRKKATLDSRHGKAEAPLWKGDLNHGVNGPGVVYSLYP